jgi:Tol biopolymer transport system component
MARHRMTLTSGTKLGPYEIQSLVGISGMVEVPLDGSRGHQITNFTSEHIAEFQWSPDGKTLAVARTEDTSDVVLLREK